MKDPGLLLENQICFRVYSLEKAILAAYKPLLDTLGITYPQYLVLLVLWEHGPSTIGGICGLLGLDTGTVSPLIKRMESHGLLVRRRLPEDERTVQVVLSQKGERLQEQAANIPKEIGSCLFGSGSSFDTDAYIGLRTSLDRAIDSLRSSGCTIEEVK